VVATVEEVLVDPLRMLRVFAVDVAVVIEESLAVDDTLERRIDPIDRLERRRTPFLEVADAPNLVGVDRLRIDGADRERDGVEVLHAGQPGPLRRGIRGGGRVR